MLRGQSQSGSQFGSRALGRCKSNIENPVIVDVDVVVIDVPETSEQGSRRSRTRRSRQSFPSDAITIIDEEGDTIESPRNSHGKASYPTSSNFVSTEGSDSDECLMIISERNFASKSAAKKRVYCKNKCSQNRFGLYHSSESDSSDCEIVEDPSGNVREQWEKASLRKKTLVKDQPRSENQDTAVGSRADPISSSPETTDDKDEAENLSKKVRSNNCEDVHVDKSSSNSTSGKENAFSSIPVLEILTEKARVESNAFQSTDPALSSPKTVHDKVDVESLINNLNHCENVLVDKSPNDSNKGKGNASFSVPMVDSTTEAQLETSGFGSGSDPVFCSPETTHEKGYAESSTNQVYPDHNDNVPMDRIPSQSSNGKEKASSNIPTFDVITEKSPVETSTSGSRAVPLFSSPDSTRDKVDAELFSNKGYSNNCTGVPFGSSPSNSSKHKDNAVSSAPTADVLTAKPSLKTSAFRLYVDSLSPSPEISPDKVGAGSCTNTMYSNCCRDVPVDNGCTSSSTPKEHMSSNIPSADNLKEKLPPEANTNNISSRVPTDKRTEEPLKTDVNTCIADSAPTCDVHGEPRLLNEGMTSEKYSSGAKSTDETLFDNKSAAFTDVEVPLWVPSSCNSRLRHNKRYVASFHEKDHIPGEPSCDTESWYKVNVEHEVFGFQGKEKSVSEPSVASCHVPTGHVRDAEFNRFNCSMEATLREPISNHHEQSGTIVKDHCKESDHLVDMLREDLMGERERHKESDEYRRAAEEEWAARIQQLQIQAEEAHQLRRKRKAEKQVLDMEKRQKQRLEEIRESQRKGEETLSLKEKLRSEVRKELGQMELRYRDMASLLRALGIHVEGGANPLSREVSAAYKKAVLKFHPDIDLLDWKSVSRLKQKRNSS